MAAFWYVCVREVKTLDKGERLQHFRDTASGHFMQNRLFQGQECPNTHRPEWQSSSKTDNNRLKSVV